ncbi:MULTISPECIES: sensor histidine kinase [Mameliella]|jgi:signal transduction histidine kinase|uniref:histidine kinase n=1 Tax=Mameliella alba TaxID=561184 RepID=A0A0B3RPV1_9RHOB|nr:MULTISPECIES: HAMP domain-containing sensor histidine kinase [Mameliella]MCR9271504.1 HAMP domain-containing histidine kinase [Paracoccaceae bacterium]ODM48240.1 ATPase [Ruegeria sp. PBVC088]KHQ53175.1 ATPase [Mameliella alba]MBY6121291.1 HAMP domain-containing histidine kinase [Mameliella alba]MDD9728477.1 HAMP domain-containing sensor histidine kinase [Mameliella sp. AT18]
MVNSLSGRFLILTIIFVMVAEVLIFVPSVARFREDYLLARLERAQIASLALLADDMIEPELEKELLDNAGVFNVVLRRDEIRQLMLSSPIPGEVAQTFDLRDASAWVLMRDAILCLVDSEWTVIRVIGDPFRDGGELIEVTMDGGPLRTAMIDYGLRILLLSAAISIITAGLLFLAVRSLLVKPIKGVVGHIGAYAEAPEDARRIIKPSATVRELREAEESLQSLQTQLTQALRQKDRLAQLGGAVARVSHDLRNILTSAQLFTDRIEMSEDPAVKRMAPKLVNSITRAVSLCESTLAFGRAEEPAPVMTLFNLAELTNEVLEAERLAIGEADVSLSEDIPAGLMVRGDPEQIYRALSNMVRNARQAIVATSQPGEINIAARIEDADWVITVTDTGPGLPPKARDHLFQPFQGGVRKGGSGLGLAIVAELVRGHGGNLRLARSDETGTCFEIRLPMGDVG